MKLFLLSIFTITVLEIVSGLIVKNPVMNKYGMEIFWIDGRDRLDEPVEIDTFFDRCVCVSSKLDPYKVGWNLYKYFQNEVTGVLITESQVLTSFNPYRKLVTSNKTFRWSFRIAILVNRYVKDGTKGASSYYGTDYETIRYISCARQVAPPFEQKTLPIAMRHGIHSPLHDLMVIRMHSNIKFANPVPYTRYDFNNYKRGYWYRRYKAYLMWPPQGPIRTDIAALGDELHEYDMKFASLGHLDDIHIFENRYLEKGNVKTDDGSKMITSCDDWIPREWGHFICLRNVHNYEGIASGAMLFGGYKLFGIGAFAIKKDKEGILVFTDVRPYRHLLYRTCTKKDQELYDEPTNRPEWWYRDPVSTSTVAAIFPG